MAEKTAEELMYDFWPEWSLIKQLGKGAYGAVYEAVRTDYTMESKSAIKIIKIPDNDAEIDSLMADGMTVDDTKTYLNGIVMDFVNEIRLMESFKGVQNIVSVEDYQVVERTEKPGYTIFIRMELLNPLNSFLGDRDMTEEEVIKLGLDMAKALEICALKKVIHRDIKPENIFVNEFGDYKLGDFGIAKKLQSLSGAMSQKGTYNYMAPEIDRGEEYNATVDIYSLGLVLYRFLNRRLLPFLTPETNTNPNARVEALKRRLSGEALPAPCDASESMAAVILKACAFDPNQRYQSARELKDDLNRVLNGTYGTEDTNDKTKIAAGTRSGTEVPKGSFSQTAGTGA
ncbi:MAG: serine/threonine protein kinase, partial [Lachnospiraceae bacterium]|nr:serine/threonine protein kinase [Lachnospiraceae bacterium]